MSTRTRILSAIAAGGVLAASVMVPTAASASELIPEDSGITVVHENDDMVQPLWLTGRHKAYPSTGGTWEYGFWNIKVRSYYTVNKCHGSTVKMDNRTSRSVNTASGKKSIAELNAVNYPGATDSYFYRVC